MKARACSFILALFVVTGVAGTPAASAAGPLEGNWRFDITRIVGDPVPFQPSGNVFKIMNPTLSQIQGQNMPQTGAALCSFTGTRSGNILSGTEVCGMPRNSFGAFRGIVTGLFQQNIYMIWADSKGVYFIAAAKLP